MSYSQQKYDAIFIKIDLYLFQVILLLKENQIHLI